MSGVLAPSTFESLIDAALTHVGHLRPQAPSFRHQAGRTKRSLDAELLARAAHQLGFHSLKLSEDTQVISGGGQRIGFFRNMAWRLTALDRLVTNDKALTKRVLEAHGLPVARGVVVRTVDEALEFFRDLGAPVVVKPITGSGGKGITVDVATEAELAAAVASVLAERRRVLVEECLTSLDLRIMVCGGRAQAAMLRVPAHVTGDGEATVADLVERKNRLRRDNPYLAHAPLRLSPAVQERLARRGLDEHSVLPAGERFFLHYKANLSAGGESYDVTRLVHPDVMRMAERAARCFASAGHAGVDVLVQRLDQPVDGQRCIVCEVNCNNDMPMHEFPLFGSPIPVARRELESYVGRRRWTPLRRLATSLSGSRGDRTPARWDIDYGQYQPPRTLEAVWAWPGIASAMAELAEHPDAAGARTARDVDTAALLESLSGLGWTDGRARGRLIHVIDGGREVMVERSGASVFARAVSRRPQALATLLTAAGVPCCRVERFDPNDWDEMLRVFHSSPPPWNLRVAGRHGTPRTRNAAASERALRREWERRSGEAENLLLDEAPRFMSLTVLLVGGEPKVTLATIPANVEGDGRSPVADLLDRKAAERDRHPYLRHHPGTVTRIRRGEVETDAVLAEGVRLFTGRSPYPSAGADTVGYPSCPVPVLVDLASRVREALGGPPVLAVTFAARPPDQRSGRPYWAVSEVDPDPVLAQFAWPWRGYMMGKALYDAVAREMQRGQRYEFADS